MRDDEYEYERSRAEERAKREFAVRLLGGIAAFPTLLLIFTWIDNAGKPHRWAAFFHRLGIDYWGSPTLQWLFN
jgi:hypothetical protein